MNIKSQTGKAPKKSKGSGLLRKRDIEQENKLRKKTLKEMSREQLEYLITDIFYEEILKRNNSKNLEEVVEKIKKKHNFSISIKQIITILGIKKSTFYYRIKKFKLPAKNKAIQYEKQIKEAFIECKGRFGRERLSLFLKKKYQIDINPRTLDRIMNKLGLLCEIRRSKRKREIKNVNATFKNLANRDYDGQINDIYATDVTYIPSPTDVIENHVYLSVLLHHKTKKIVSWNLSKYNDTNLVLKHFKLTKFLKKFIVHSDHGYQYSSKEFLDYIDSINGSISMTRVGNSLDNREVEYFFFYSKNWNIFKFFQKSKKFNI
ncbi:DDE-type integrase/transposase/recombinase [Metamycoplasma hominis]|uniref:DDE-type integrase/transposase/recombinase n=1 Tax=Metamycoplasma hominis TaxID=2098 RepID=UPI001F09025B|nr:DDE-type integrase/transposase/recombinase [Metamycoplasma hominis]